MRHARALAAMAVTMLVLDLGWLGVVAKPWYDAALGDLRRPVVLWSAALLFYAFYLVALHLQVVRKASSLRDAFAGGAWLGLVAYGTYELTNWAVIRDWPAWLVPLDLAWGVLLTGVVAAAGRWAAGPAVTQEARR